ncbi:cyclopropane-fatty-acyl-phospholipid synthase family protein [Streptomyces sp. FIT100]|uniref:SAM-dependent methyltransferase n=1 Tax=Streptomyces sp. FIT100 TaxID=2837956 RepID=UPI0021C6D689|nr:class I SAM-dependent methyltransferase [Streptomyces sp. FIT100]UUN25328.1 methyltransferase domain-containing protein [Streptomyces sp. FIT100]
MSDTGTPPRLTRLTFHGPLSEARAAQLVTRLVRNSPASVLDIGCGWGELMLRVLEAAPDAKGIGIDLNADDLARGRRTAGERGLDGRAEFVEESATGTTRGPADVVLCVGSGQALLDSESGSEPAGAGASLSATVDALRALRTLVAPGGRALFGEGFWQRTPAADELAAMWPGARVDDHLPLAAITEAATAAGFRVEWIETATEEEWEHFESGYLADVEEWLAANAGHPLAAETRNRVDRHRASWLRGYRGVLGLVYLTLVPVA